MLMLMLIDDSNLDLDITCQGDRKMVRKENEKWDFPGVYIPSLENPSEHHMRKTFFTE